MALEKTDEAAPCAGDGTRAGCKALWVLFAAVALDAFGIGLVMPVLPGLLRNLTHADQVAGHYGVLVSLYAVMQFAFAPVLGFLSDRYGRRPVLLVSLAGAAIDYAIMATAPTLTVLYLGRMIAGITGATGAVAGAAIADTTEGEARARHFGTLGACFGVGMIAGPVAGGLLGSIGLHAPFAAAAVMNGFGFLFALFFLAESRKDGPANAPAGGLNPLAGLRQTLHGPLLLRLVTVFFVMQLVGQVPAVLWVIFGEHRFGWDARMTGVSLAAFGLLHAVAQGVIAGPAAARLGERRAVELGIVLDSLGYGLLALASASWMVLPIMLLLAAGGIGSPALQALLSRAVDEEGQGRLQGALASLTSLASIVGPLLFIGLYSLTLASWDGWVWIAGIGLYLLCVPALRRLPR
ncbi:Tet(A)/Tet(B)/Tet(C) family tetracycline efflux MFS transporter [Ensifer adhaerens]|uniref:Tet(A)/Tet(B)/Tet(C) family tetracycline efflux MFS transporter n=1 Tax=Ensifer adhaerens TaxID=106592 RepID=UPI001CC1470F|nr:Tet(A)/Tet(B)/Tet(C) family tetracycline efflux MFS transporter [Ensifer adhaerens]MBZ7922426.1 Tet(A)/Tet(B)/Tet(C) family tetracycline efflux MFS transporter [Ensifer adhaerens]UAX91055.1 Tet(A)/Tet(B)/Tet(C) family tetracycline efflux MFS transporter [Ensifer adhaerens]UAX98684.1 Tet(A)/Tet(B)/Tet(C) family tetracycline efflux MFS transporter [Ensifer adhaerens]UAY06065.1 Tet(A)/Tet(B)/Tet(C) family tetracycline efflux MFS transporter [Ensifer adhaerens]